MTNHNKTQDLLQLYAIERQDDTTALVLGFSMATAVFTYMIAAFIFVDNHGHQSTILVRLLAPLVPTAIAGFLTLNTAATLIRSVHLQRIEAQLRRDVPSATFHTDAGLVWRPEKVDIRRLAELRKPPLMRHIFTIVTYAVYAIVYLTIPGFTMNMIYFAPWTRWKVVAFAGYGLAQVIILMGLIIPLFNSRFQYDATAAQTCPTCGSKLTQP